MTRRGTIYTYSVVHSGTAAFQDKTPYLLAVVEDEGRKTLARIEGFTGHTEIAIGMEVEFLAEDDAGTPVYAFI